MQVSQNDTPLTGKSTLRQYRKPRLVDFGAVANVTKSGYVLGNEAIAPSYYTSLIT
jgi:hypothetical protein